MAISRDPLRVTLLGTGIPIPQANAFGTSTLVEAGKQRILIDCGRGTVIRMAQLGLPVGCIDKVILSHYHSDHYAGLFDLLMTGTIPQGFAGRGGPLHVYGPTGLEHIAEGAWAVSKPDRDIRVADGEIEGEDMRLIPHLYKEGIVYERDGLRILAIEVDHGEAIRPAFAFRVEYNGHVFVHSHDTRYCENLVNQARGADVFVHEVAAARESVLNSHPAIKIACDHHASPADVGRIFSKVRPGLALLTHIVLLKPDPVSVTEVLEELAKEYDGTVLVAEDLMQIVIGRNVSVIPFRHGGNLCEML